MDIRKWTVGAVVAAITLGIAGCSGDATGIEATAPASPRPAGTGLLAQAVVRADIASTVADAGVPDNAPDYGRMSEGLADTVASCVVAFKGFGEKGTTVDFARFEAVTRELRERQWTEDPGARKEDRTADGTVGRAETILRQRGWIMTADLSEFQDEGVITLRAIDQACFKKYRGQLEVPDGL
ncbi:hypothetical protein [Streptomyces sp. NPDC094049]|uniref:hypothetical protein n=1 Tax=Streptomyces sp. NPDC094049 TaxID=3154987 RepID=UPI00332E7020